ncbi:DEAD/DEAH box helicase domain protein [Pseudopedobacter saltans DSM 12145]|uniref:DEAD-box ATP-dependent RNA helicase RhpA n=1 Tax=Pseudopedobacter saltans (strain ATCC 51119 / DSM 12145 / JCM 21818 / CCUG 39354 / LMG 10337 / NBRC 100064 / NCIMB 13643) TaxID=762903 RepID=F0SDX7_PSESL|nr:DEAD/DEAH box helicase [Pseudopedobacter saltans]ADY51873.1 DEAD/DEAH box helicase domain protein [Pseudopedobacter saltans DSM 12145]
MTSFETLNLIQPIQKALKALNYQTPTPIQAQAIPLILQRKDLLGCAQTGTGKTAAFAIPILQLLDEDLKKNHQKNTIKALIVTPTRELAIQIGDSFSDYGKNLRLKHAVIFGGVNQKSQVDALQKGVDILVATPGRLLDLMHQKHLSLKHINLFVLDEADRMLDMGFINDVKKIIAVLPQHRQSLFFSATMPPVIQKLSEEILKSPVKVEVTPVSSTADTINQTVFFVDKNNKNDLLLHILKDQLLDSVLVFTRTKHGADRVVKTLAKQHIKSAAIHGNKSQNARQRALDDFKTKAIRVLVATDIAARGIDIDSLKYVINYEIPNIPETYVHRIGRSGRAGAEGIAISFCDVDEKPFLKDIEKIIGKSVPLGEDNPFPMENFVAKETSKKQGKKPQQQARKPEGNKPKAAHKGKDNDRKENNWKNKERSFSKEGNSQSNWESKRRRFRKSS